MDVLDHLIEEHRKAEQLIATLETTEPGSTRASVLAELSDALDLHMEVEERDVYPLVQEHLGSAKSDEAEKEHNEARDLLAQLKDRSGRTFAASSPLAVTGRWPAQATGKAGDGHGASRRTLFRARPMRRWGLRPFIIRWRSGLPGHHRCTRWPSSARTSFTACRVSKGLQPYFASLMPGANISPALPSAPRPLPRSSSRPAIIWPG